jgi:hypothetical protein
VARGRRRISWRCAGWACGPPTIGAVHTGSHADSGTRIIAVKRSATSVRSLLLRSFGFGPPNLRNAADTGQSPMGAGRLDPNCRRQSACWNGGLEAVVRSRRSVYLGSGDDGRWADMNKGPARLVLLGRRESCRSRVPSVGHGRASARSQNCPVGPQRLGGLHQSPSKPR